MARRIIASDTEDRFGIRILWPDKTCGWIVGNDGDYLLFRTEREAAKALKAMKSNDNYTWNCTAEVATFRK